MVGSGIVRRIRRTADLSQRDLASALGLSQTTVARWETGRLSPSFACLQKMAAMADLRLVLVDVEDRIVLPMLPDRAHDRAGRRYPAHLDPHADEWWTPPGSDLTGNWLTELLRSRALGRPRVRYLHRGFWRDLVRRMDGFPSDHPSTERLIDDVDTRDAARARALGRRRPTG